MTITVGGKKSIGEENAAIRARGVVRQPDKRVRGTVGSFRQMHIEEELSGSWAWFFRP